MIRLLFAAAPLLALAACASDGVTAQTTQTAQAEPGQKLVCEREQRTGSMLGKRECAPAMTDEDRRRLSTEVGNMVKPRGITAPGS
jgi:hypothetical protein